VDLQLRVVRGRLNGKRCRLGRQARRQLQDGSFVQLCVEAKARVRPFVEGYDLVRRDGEFLSN
jgi:hypothetical protein